MIKNWQTGIKYAWDIGLLDKAIVVLSGSSAVDLTYSSEKLPGRKGGGHELNKLLLPISFRDFLKFKGIETESITKGALFSLEGHDFAPYKMNYNKIQSYFLEYIHIGGIPVVLDTYVKTKTINDPVLLDIYSDVFFSTMGKMNKNRTILLQIIRKIMQINFSRFSWQSFTSDIDIGSFHTTMEYLENMADSYFIGILYFMDFNKKQLKSKKEKKIYITDPIFLKLFQTLSGSDANIYFSRDDFFGLYLENIAYQHVIKIFRKEAFDGLSNLQNISFWYSDKQKEVDFLLYDSNRILPIEIKYQKTINEADYSLMERTFRKGLILTKDSFFEDERIIGIPLSIFIACI